MQTPDPSPDNIPATSQPTVLVDVTPGHKTSEFALTVGVILLVTLEGLQGVMPPKWSAIIAAMLAVSWKVTRMCYKWSLGKLHVDQILGVSETDAALAALDKAKTSAMIVPAIALMLAGGACLSGCAGTGAQWKATGTVVASRAATIAGRVVLNAAIAGLTGNDKANFLDSAATGLRAEMPNIVTSGDIEAIVKIWTPEHPAFSKLAVNLAQQYAAAPGTPVQKAEAIAEGLNAAAAVQRAGIDTGLAK